MLCNTIVMCRDSQDWKVRSSKWHTPSSEDALIVHILHIQTGGQSLSLSQTTLLSIHILFLILEVKPN